MRNVLVNQAKPGDEVASPVMNDRGMVILPKGSRLTRPLIDRMMKMGVIDVTLTGDDPNAPPPKSREELLADLEARFEGMEKSTTMMEIKRIARDHLMNRPG